MEQGKSAPTPSRSLPLNQRRKHYQDYFLNHLVIQSKEGEDSLKKSDIT